MDQQRARILLKLSSFSSMFFISCAKCVGKLWDFPLFVCKPFFAPSSLRRWSEHEMKYPGTTKRGTKFEWQICADKWTSVLVLRLLLSLLCLRQLRTTFSYFFARWAFSFCVVIAMIKRSKAKFAKQIKTTTEKTNPWGKLKLEYFLKSKVLTKRKQKINMSVLAEALLSYSDVVDSDVVVHSLSVFSLLRITISYFDSTIHVLLNANMKRKKT